jgi:TPR repeat protein
LDIDGAARLLERANQAIAARRLSVYVSLLKRAARLGNPEAKENLAAWYLEGLRTQTGRVVLRRSPGRAVALLVEAAEEHNPLAQFSLAYCFDLGIGVRRNPLVAAVWYRKAANRGISYAAANLAVLCRQQGDFRGERRWLARAARLGDEHAQLELARLTLKSTVSRRRKEEALRRLRRVAASSGPDSTEAMLAIADAYSGGLGVRRSETLAAKWRAKALDSTGSQSDERGGATQGRNRTRKTHRVRRTRAPRRPV